MDPSKLYPLQGFTNTLLLKPLIEQSEVNNVFAGEYSYYSDFNDPSKFLTDNVLYNYGFSGAALYIGKFCALAHGVKFIMPDANHATSGVSTFPFAIFGGKWAEPMPITDYPFKQSKDTVLGNDVWLGMEVTVMPGVSIGDGAIVGSKSVVASDIPAYAIAVGNPAKVVKHRYNEKEKQLLLVLCWWDWPVDLIELAIPTLVKGDLQVLLKFAQSKQLVE